MNKQKQKQNVSRNTRLDDQISKFNENDEKDVTDYNTITRMIRHVATKSHETKKFVNSLEVFFANYLRSILAEQNWDDSIKKLKEKLSEIRNLYNHDMTRLPNYTWVWYRKPYKEFIGEITKQPHSKIFSQLWKDAMHYFKDIILNGMLN